MNDLHFFKAAREASKAADYTGVNSVKIGCVAVYKGTILAKGSNSNRTHPVQEKFNRYRYKDVGNRYLPAKVHCEVSCVQKIKYLDIDFSKVHIYLYREFKDGTLAPSCCCPSCKEYLKSFGIKHIHYTNTDGYYHLKLV